MSTTAPTVTELLSNCHVRLEAARRACKILPDSDNKINAADFGYLHDAVRQLAVAVQKLEHRLVWLEQKEADRQIRPLE